MLFDVMILDEPIEDFLFLMYFLLFAKVNCVQAMFEIDPSRFTFHWAMFEIDPSSFTFHCFIMVVYMI